MTLGATLVSVFFPASGFLYPHFMQARTRVASLPLLDFFGSRRDPHLGQNSMFPILPLVIRLGIPLALYLLKVFLFSLSQEVTPEAIKWATRSGSGKQLLVEVNFMISSASLSEIPASSR